MQPAPILDFAGHEFRAMKERALFWPRHRALIVADLHLEKASWYAAQGQMLPPYDSHDTLDRLHRLIVATDAAAVWCLGDSFHDRDAQQRIAPAIAAQLNAIARAVDLVWVAGNHDGLIDENWGGRVCGDLLVDGIMMRHQSERTETRPEISGHFHPKLRMMIRDRPVSRPCFAGDDQRLILPAFGSLTGGLDVQDPAIRANFFSHYDALTISGSRLLRFVVGNVASDDVTSVPVSTSG